jgi:glycerol-3-phosphate acyltransferase PlsY
MTDALLAVVFLALAYLIGSVSFALLAGRLVAGIDLRSRGSGNLGATNVVRVLGRPVGLTVFLLDVAKGFVPAFFFPRLAPALPVAAIHPGIVFGVAAILGHVFPFYLRFKGGKGVATTTGVLLALAPAAFFIGTGVWFATLFAFRFVSLASVAMAAAFPASLVLLDPSRAFGEDLSVTIAVAAVCALLVVRHRANLARIAAGTEPRVFSKRDEEAKDSKEDAPT